MREPEPATVVLPVYAQCRWEKSAVMIHVFLQCRPVGRLTAEPLRGSGLCCGVTEPAIVGSFMEIQAARQTPHTTHCCNPQVQVRCSLVQVEVEDETRRPQVARSTARAIPSHNPVVRARES
uniref:Uncharacterized protein n=1 Tax=Oryza punctata TaxID=4537 RepID=A0A0E0M1D2_ORYPU